MKMPKNFVTITALLMLSACGGGGGSAGGTSTTTTAGTNPTTVNNTTATESNPLTAGLGGSTTQTGGAVSVAIGFNDKIKVSPDDQQYFKDYIIKVVDNNGFPVKGATIAPRIDVVRYGKGFLNDQKATPAPTETFTLTRVCDSEDINGNDVLDAGEDTNGDLKLTPARATVSLQAVNGLVTNNDGVVLFQMQYPKSYAAWLAVRLTVSTKVSGSEGKSSELFGLGFVAGDEKQPGAAFSFSPYGRSNACTDAF
jgi:hypothetical protein